MFNRKHTVALAVAGALLIAAPIGALAQDAASDTKVASVAGGPHPSSIRGARAPRQPWQTSGWPAAPTSSRRRGS